MTKPDDERSVLSHIIAAGKGRMPLADDDEQAIAALRAEVAKMRVEIRQLAFEMARLLRARGR